MVQQVMLEERQIVRRDKLLLMSNCMQIVLGLKQLKVKNPSRPRLCFSAGKLYSVWRPRRPEGVLQHPLCDEGTDETSSVSSSVKTLTADASLQWLICSVKFSCALFCRFWCSQTKRTGRFLSCWLRFYTWETSDMKVKRNKTISVN